MNTTTILTIVAIFLIVDLTADSIIIKRMGYNVPALLKAAWGRLMVRIGVRPQPVPVTYSEPEGDEYDSGAYSLDGECQCSHCTGNYPDAR